MAANEKTAVMAGVPLYVHRSYRRGSPIRTVAPSALVDEVLVVDAESVCDPIDVVEVGADLGCVVDRSLVPSDGAEGVDVGGSHGGRRVGQLLCMCQ